MAGLIGWYAGREPTPVGGFAFEEVSVSYAPFVDTHLARAKRHEDRAEYWLSEGKPDYAKGSMRKAARARQKYREFDMWRSGPLPSNGSQDLLSRYIAAAQNRMVESLEAALLGGNQ